MDKGCRNMGNRGSGQIRDAGEGIPGRGYGAAREGCGYGVYIMDSGSHVRLHFDSPKGS